MFVFAGKPALKQVEAVCAVEGLELHLVLDLLGSLGDKSLLLVKPSAYRQSETVPQFGREQLLDSGEWQRARRCHAEYYASSNSGTPSL